MYVSKIFWTKSWLQLCVLVAFFSKSKGYMSQPSPVLSTGQCPVREGGRSPPLEASQLSGFQLLIATLTCKWPDDWEGSPTPNKTNTFLFGQIYFTIKTNTHCNFDKFYKTHICIIVHQSESYPRLGLVYYCSCWIKFSLKFFDPAFFLPFADYFAGTF